MLLSVLILERKHVDACTIWVEFRLAGNKLKGYFCRDGKAV